MHRTFQAAYPGRKGFANSGTPRASTTAGGVEGQAMLHLGQTPRMREVFMASSSGGGGTDRGGHISEMFLGGGGGGQGGGQRGRASSPEMGGGMSRREAREDGFSPPHTSPKSGIDSPDRNSPTPGRNSSAPVVPKLRLGGAGGDAPVPPPQMPKLNLGGTRPAEPSQRSARGELSLGLPPAPALDLGAQLEIALGDDEDTEPAPDASSQMFMQEVAILQMQAEGWKAEWSIAMQENERLRMALFDAESALESLPPKEEGAPEPAKEEGGDDEMQWRELCTSIARAADEEKAALLEELNRVRADLEGQRTQSGITQDEYQRAEVEANKARANAENWKAQFEREQEEHDRLDAQLKEMLARTEEAKTTARGTQENSAIVLIAWREATKKRNEAENKYQSRKREAEAKLTGVYNSHRQQLERLQQEIALKKSEQSEIMQQMNRWRTQWEEEMAEKNAVAAELLTLRSEFEKSSGTYDKEIEGLKDMLERTRTASSEMRDRWEESVTRKNALLGQLEEEEKNLGARGGEEGEARMPAALRASCGREARCRMKQQAGGGCEG